MIRWRVLGLAIPMMMGGCLSFHSGPITGAPDDATYVVLRDTRIHFIDDGPRDAPAVVLIHGFASSTGVWRGIRETLRERYRVIALDLKGFGLSARPAGDYSPEEQARLVLALMDERGIQRAALVAHSFGASVALQVALMAPERVGRIALYDAWTYSDQLPTAFHWARGRGVGELIFGAFYAERPEDKMALAFFDPERMPQELVDNVEEQLARPGTRAAALASVRAMRFEAQEARYGEIEQPVLLLWGREDTVTPLRYGERLLNELPDGRLEVYPRCGHFPMIEAARPSSGELLAFLSESSRASRSHDALTGSGGRVERRRSGRGPSTAEDGESDDASVGAGASGSEVPQNGAPPNTESGNGASGNGASGNGASGNDASGESDRTAVPGSSARPSTPDSPSGAWYERSGTRTAPRSSGEDSP